MNEYAMNNDAQRPMGTLGAQQIGGGYVRSADPVPIRQTAPDTPVMEALERELAGVVEDASLLRDVVAQIFHGLGIDPPPVGGADPLEAGVKESRIHRIDLSIRMARALIAEQNGRLNYLRSRFVG